MNFSKCVFDKANPEKTTDLSQVNDKLYRIILYRVHHVWAGFELTMLVVIGTDCIGSYKSNYHTIAITTAPGVKTLTPNPSAIEAGDEFDIHPSM
jgi:hypothetical protein